MTSAGEPSRHSLFSQSNHRRLPVWVWEPPGDGPFPLLLLLHGVYDADGSGWWRLGRAHEAAAALDVPPVVVMPSDTGVELGSGWCDWADGSAAAETHLVDEVLPWAGSTYRLTRQRWVTGLSMGGYGAVLLALRNPGLFTSVSSTSGFLDPARLFDFVPDAAVRMWGPDGAGRASHDPRSLLATASPHTVPRLALDCGLDDPLLEENRRSSALLDACGVAHGYAEHPGGHDWAYWRERLPDHLAFHSAADGPLTPPRAATGRS